MRGHEVSNEVLKLKLSHGARRVDSGGLPAEHGHNIAAIARKAQGTMNFALLPRLSTVRRCMKRFRNKEGCGLRHWMGGMDRARRHNHKPPQRW